MTDRLGTLLWLAQRASAAILAFCIAVHLVTMIYAVQGGLSAAEILSRTRGSLIWLAFYGVFVLAVAIHAPIGLRSVLREFTPWRGRSVEGAMLGVAVMITWLGWRAVLGLFR